MLFRSEAEAVHLTVAEPVRVTLLCSDGMLAVTEHDTAEFENDAVANARSVVASPITDAAATELISRDRSRRVMVTRVFYHPTSPRSTLMRPHSVILTSSGWVGHRACAQGAVRPISRALRGGPSGAGEVERGNGCSAPHGRAACCSPATGRQHDQ